MSESKMNEKKKLNEQELVYVNGGKNIGFMRIGLCSDMGHFICAF